MNRKITLKAPKQVSEHTQITGADLAYCYFDPGALRVYMNGGALSETVPLEGLEPADRQLVEDFAAMLCRVTGEEMETGAAKGREASGRAAREADKRAENPKPAQD